MATLLDITALTSCNLLGSYQNSWVDSECIQSIQITGRASPARAKRLPAGNV
jgi:hypothetical protein